MAGLKHPFSEKTRYLFDWPCKCWFCGSHQNKLGHNVDALHHILKRVSNSPFNAAPIHNNVCHLYNAELTQWKVRQRLLKQTFSYLMSKGYVPTKKDERFLKFYAEYYE